jgi:hypothetical protein
MRKRACRMTVIVVAVLAIALGAFSTTTPADDGFFPCDVVCVPIPHFPFILCAPSCPEGPPPGP